MLYQKAIKIVSRKTDYLHVSLDIIDLVDKIFALGATEQNLLRVV